MLRRSHFLKSSLALAAAMGLDAAPAAAAFPPPEKTSLKVGVSVAGMSFMPVYVAAAKTWKAQGLDVQVIGFRGDAEVSQALVGGSVDVSVESLNGFINMISSGQPVIGFYCGFWKAEFSWYGQGGVKHWPDLKGKTIGVSTYGSLTDALTRYVLRRNHLDPEKDVQIVQAGGTASAFASLKAGRLAASILSPPFNWYATDAGMTLLGTQERDVWSTWPDHLYGARTDFLAANPHTIEALLRGHVAAIRLARDDPAAIVPPLMDIFKYSQADTERMVQFELEGLNERGGLPEKAMPAFWNITASQGDVQSAWPTAKFLDLTYVRSFKTWAPAG